MDPVSAVGVAAAALQFVEVSIKAYHTFQEIRLGSDLATEHNQQLEDNLRSAQNLRIGLLSTSGPLGASDPVSKLTEQCMFKADELLTLLEYVRGSGKSIGSVRAMARWFRKRKAIEELQLSLNEHQDTLNHMISQQLLPSIDLLKVQQSKEFANISSIGQKLIEEQIEQRRVQEVHNSTVTHKLDHIQQDMQLHVDEADRKKRREKLLESLWFPQIDHRRNEIKPPAPSTLEWFFESKSGADSESDESSESNQTLVSDDDLLLDDWQLDKYHDNNFRQWLREDASTYWICGKAGSGKSTLMAHIVDDDRTREDLETSGQRVEIMAFFFCRAGSELQNSVLGLLRSLLYQLCLLEPAIIDAILSKLSSPVAMMPTWTERSLLNFAYEAIQSCEHIRLCILIDGLDEFTGPYDDLADHIDRLGSCRNLKLCVSSRPELELVRRLQCVKHIHLQDLNMGDIMKFVRKSLRKTHLNKQFRGVLIRKVVERANGVFLWASLVAKSLVKGARAGDSEEIMLERLDTLPTDMSQLFEQMLFSVDPVHRKSLAFYVQMKELLDEHDIPFTVLVVAQLNKSVNSYEEFENECKLTKTRISTRSAGLLEVVDSNSYGSIEDEWKQSRTKFLSNNPNFGQLSKQRDRRRCSDDEPFPAVLTFEKCWIRWIHRSAFDFLSSLSSSPLIDFEWSREELLRRIGESWTSYVIDAPSWTRSFHAHSQLCFQIKPIVEFIAKWYADYPIAATALLDIWRSTCTEIKDINELYNENISHYSLCPQSKTTNFFFWDTCMSCDLYQYMLCNVNSILKHETDVYLATYLLSRALRNSWAWMRVVATEFTNGMADALFRTISQVLDVGKSAKAIQYNCIVQGHLEHHQERFCSIAWGGPATDVWIQVIGHLAHTLSRRFLEDLRMPQCYVPVPASLCTTLDAMEFYISKGSLELYRVHIQISATAWVKVNNSLAERGCCGDRLSAHTSGSEVQSLIQLLCLPDPQRLIIYEWISSDSSSEYESRSFPGAADVVEAPNFIRIQPSAATSDQLLNISTRTKRMALRKYILTC